MLRQDWNVKVQIRDDLKKSLIFGFESRLPIAVILGFAGYRHEILPVM